MPSITLEESFRQIDALHRRADEARTAGRREDAVRILRELLDHPCAQHGVAADDVLDEIHRHLREAGRYDAAIAAKREAIAAGYRSSPDPEADIAECLVEAGRRDEADSLYAELRERDPEDVWLYNSAGFVYAGVDDREALRWCLDGIEVALATGDPDRVVGQLLDTARRQWDALDEPHEGTLVERVEAFEVSWERPALRTPRWDAAPQKDDQPCGHCGYDPEGVPGDPLAEWTPPRRTERAAIALAWFPADEWVKAVERWPDLLDYLPEDHLAYSHRIESRLKMLFRHGVAQGVGVAPLSIAGLDALKGEDPGSGEARSHLAAEMARLGTALPWPPGRNERCWCGSGRKYKQCCGPVPPAEDQP